LVQADTRLRTKTGSQGTECATALRLFALLSPLSIPQLTANVQTVAGIISPLNDYQLLNNLNQPRLGFLNT
jgi:hypothetical protein